MHFIGIQKLLCFFYHLSAVHVHLGSRLSAQEDILRNCHIGNQHQLLVHNGNTSMAGCHDAVNIHFLPVNDNFSLFCMVDSTQYLNQSGFTRSVLTKESVYLTGFQLKIYILQCLYTGEGFTDSFHLK